MKLGYGISFGDLYSEEGISKIDALFCELLQQSDSELFELFIDRRHNLLEESEFIVKLSPFFDYFIANLFDLSKEIKTLRAKYLEIEILLKCRRNFVQRRVAKQTEYSDEKVSQLLHEAITILAEQDFDFDSELSMAKSITQWQETHQEKLIDAAAIYCAWAIKNKKHSLLFSLPERTNYEDLIHNMPEEDLRNRDQFNLNDHGLNNARALAETKYCIHCHKQNKDSCSKGMYDSKNNNQLAQNPLNVDLSGCPLKEKISEMNFTRSIGLIFAPLAIAIIDNPMIAATGHRICNDCMKSCIYQKQQPVDIPFVETETLQAVLDMPYGFEIYALLVKWNPLNFKQWQPMANINKKVLVVGLGPAGFTACHYLLNQGMTVTAIDGLKIEPLPSQISGIDQDGSRVCFEPIKNIRSVFSDLNERIPLGFGGVMEYGITVRWNKNYLKIIRLLLERRGSFRMYGGIRFGSNITYKQAQELGFDHIVLALGAGSPNILGIPNELANGVKTASDFLMSLQLLAPYQKHSLANLQIELPIVVIGGGLTAVDAATESLNYYASQVEKLLNRYEIFGEKLFITLDREERRIADKFLDHAKKLRESPKQKAQLLKKWGGATIIYRKSMKESPSYRLNYEELQKALEEGVMIIDHAIPEKIEVDQYGHCSEIIHSRASTPARTILVAIGTKPNTILSKEDREHFKVTNGCFDFSASSYVTTLGDLDPQYAGNVVRAMASAKDRHKEIVSKAMLRKENEQYFNHKTFFQNLDNLFLAKVKKINILADNIVEIIIKAPSCAQNFEPGQFYKLQNYSLNAIMSNSGDLLSMEPLALTGAKVDKEKGMISMIALEMSGSSDFCRYLKKGEVVSLMGPTGMPTVIPREEVVMLIGGGLGNAVLFSIGQAMRQNGCKVLYFAGYRSADSLYKKDEIELAADVVVWCCDKGSINGVRPQDMFFDCNIVEAIKRYSLLEDSIIKTLDVQRMIVIGSDGMMNAVAYAKNTSLKSLFRDDMKAFVSVNSPMHCMMKEICAQCLQENIDPVSGKKTYVYTCAEQDQEMESVNFRCLSDRLKQNCLAEKITASVISSIKMELSASS